MSKDALETSPAQDLLQRKETGPGPLPPRSMEHLAFAVILSHGMDVSSALAGLSCLRQSFVDWNEIRVARIQEIARCLGKTPEAQSAAKEIREEYNRFFEKKGLLGFDFLAAGKPAESRRMLSQQMPKLSKGAAAMLLYEFCPGASLPISDEGLRHARRDGIVGKSGDRNQLTRVLADAMELSQSALLVQHWEIEATGSPYGEPAKKEHAAKKARKAPTKAKAPAKGKEK